MIESFKINGIAFKLINYSLGSNKNCYELKSKGLCKVFESKLEALGYARFWSGV